MPGEYTEFDRGYFFSVNYMCQRNRARRHMIMSHTFDKGFGPFGGILTQENFIIVLQFNIFW